MQSNASLPFEGHFRKYAKSISREIYDNEELVYERSLDPIGDFTRQIFEAGDPNLGGIDQKIFRLVVGKVLSEDWRLFDQVYEIAQCLETCNSPIERLFMAAAIASARDLRCSYLKIAYYKEIKCPKLGNRVYQGWKELYGPLGPGYTLEIQPQAKIERYRADFIVSWVEMDAKWEDPSDELRLTELSRHSVLVECDGHEFHEKTKEQVAKDKKRERALLKLGHRILRFSGSELWKDPFGCVQEVFEFLEGMKNEAAVPNSSSHSEAPIVVEKVEAKRLHYPG